MKFGDVQSLGQTVLKHGLIRNRGVNYWVGYGKMLFKGSTLILTFVLVAVAAVASVVGYVVLCLSPFRDVTIEDIASNPESFDGVHVRLRGYIVKPNYFLGPKYVLRDGRWEVALSEKGKSGGVQLERFVSFIIGGQNRTQLRDMVVSVSGCARYIGFVVDSPSYYVEVEDVKIQTVQADLIMLGSQQVRIEADKTNYSVGEPVRFRVFQKNLNSEPARAAIGEIRTDISDSRGESVYSTSIHVDWVANFTVSPNEEVEPLTIFPSWDQTNNQRQQVTPDIYTITLQISPSSDEAVLWLKIAIIQ